MSHSVRINASSEKLHSHSANPLVFRTREFSRKPTPASCYGSSCPMVPQVVTIEDKVGSKVIIHFPWLSDSFLLLPVIRNQLSVFTLDYHTEMHGLLKKEDEIEVSDMVSDKDEIVLFVEYAKFPPRLVEQFRYQADRRSRSNIEDIAIVHYSLLAKSVASKSATIGDYRVSRDLREAISYLPQKF